MVNVTPELVQPPRCTKRRRPRIAPWRSATIGAVLGVIIASHFFHQPFGMGQSNLDDWMLVVGALAGGYIGYLLPTMPLHPFAR